MDLNTEKFKPYSKSSNTLVYVHGKSNHPPNIIRNIPESVNGRLSEISSNEAVFTEAVLPCIRMHCTRVDTHKNWSLKNCKEPHPKDVIDRGKSSGSIRRITKMSKAK